MIAMQNRTTFDERLAFDAQHIPQELRDRVQWLNWTYRERDSREAKVPVDAAGHAIDATDPARWRSFDEACAIAEARGHGIALALSDDDPYVGVDLDDCVDAGGELSDDARSIIQHLGSYAETSPSGTGVKLVLRATKPASAGCKTWTPSGHTVEIYGGKRFFTITGRRVDIAPGGVAEAQEALDALCARLWPPKQSPRPETSHMPFAALDDDEVIRRASKAANGDLFARLWAGDTTGHGGDDSSADLALCNLLAFWTGSDAAQIDRLFRRSGLMRPKWDERRGARTYGQITVAKAIEDAADVYSGRAAEHEEAAMEGPFALGEPDSESGRLVLSRQRTLPTARAYLRQFHSHPEHPTLIAHGDGFYEWQSNRWSPITDGSVGQRLFEWLDRADEPYRSKPDGWGLRPFPANPRSVADARESIRSLARLPDELSPPCWIGGEAIADLRSLLACPSGMLSLPTGEWLAPTPRLFTTAALDFDIDPDSPDPTRWTQFLQEVFGDDTESVHLLQEWFGYCLTADTSQQKMLYIVGPKRSGKGTIGRVLRRLVGEARSASPTTSTLASQFGLQSLLGKSMAIVSDARFRGRDIHVAIERLLCISGEDTLPIERKHTTTVTAALPTRFMFLSNELPRLEDASGALASRFLLIRLEHTFLGKEDLGLFDALSAEMPGILNWAIEGWRRLHERGCFVQPTSGTDEVELMQELGSPVSHFVRDECEIGHGRVSVATLYERFTAWCAEQGVRPIPPTTAFGRDLKAAFGLTRKRDAADKGFYEGIQLRRST